MDFGNQLDTSGIQERTPRPYGIERARSPGIVERSRSPYGGGILERARSPYGGSSSSDQSNKNFKIVTKCNDNVRWEINIICDGLILPDNITTKLKTNRFEK
jgi:hypothetical protein